MGQSDALLNIYYRYIFTNVENLCSRNREVAVAQCLRFFAFTSHTCGNDTTSCFSPSACFLFLPASRVFALLVTATPNSTFQLSLPIKWDGRDAAAAAGGALALRLSGAAGTRSCFLPRVGGNAMAAVLWARQHATTGRVPFCHCHGHVRLSRPVQQGRARCSCLHTRMCAILCLCFCFCLKSPERIGGARGESSRSTTRKRKEEEEEEEEILKKEERSVSLVSFAKSIHRRETKF
ncbi:hypothetical protein B0T24DRAFT_406442 [Lasiosphaeria ovina]|uniref:Uncharacterized protein n=1 Tax=Lasiosphaeria ovina TaxID=92902 RepID=A0AAE0JWX9_9PEZI|nr:hypothetical protein B0T24DRAFT_406442 [Lasiosphaeria ovina]